MRTIPGALQNHLTQHVTTTCRLLRIQLQNGNAYGMTTLDRDVTYGGTTYSAMNGFDPSIIASDASYSVDNSEGYALLSADIPGITVEMALRGDLDGATWQMMIVNYHDLSGHILLDAGDVGEVRVVDDTVFMPELVSYAMRLRQSIGHVDSIRCRAVFGTPANAQTGCGVVATSLWQSGTVTGVDEEEPRRVFYGSTAIAPPARLRWLTGDNVSTVRVYQVEEAYPDPQDEGWVHVFEPLPFPIVPGDTYEIRQDCDKSLSTCRDVYDNMINYKGEPLIPIGEGSDIPGANL